jgi:hypothetical protein
MPRPAPRFLPGISDESRVEREETAAGTVLERVGLLSWVLRNGDSGELKQCQVLSAK